ncbi:MAG: amino acid ABC transporter substrate-binding protein [Lamprobacter sp.]|uniref:amino acid ABC transporter substrate-binding protein n=1 Tax=Lamprobacter sp. TaxID=3100796 RepID=UPI002B25C792|nr:amino acid ABC transporter substrate-binding protein [Lamprobacter sp.]MEA3639581.1 amino acid ABC transporter substrate-binding protein [Lamprobacter sp.]
MTELTALPPASPLPASSLDAVLGVRLRLRQVQSAAEEGQQNRSRRLQSMWRLIAAALILFTCRTACADTGALDRIKAAEAIRIAYSPTAYPISFKDAQGVPRGYSVDLCRHIVTAVQASLGLDALEIAWIEGNTPRRVAAVANGEADIECGTTTMSLARQRQVDFSNIVFVESGGILVKSDRGLRGLDDLAGRKVGVVPETTTERRLRPALIERGIELELVPIRDAQDGRERLLADELDAVAGDRLVLVGQVAETGKAEAFAIVDAYFSVEPYAFALPRNDADFRLEVNRGLAEVYRSGEIDQIFQRWFGEDSAPTRLLETIYFIYGFVD